MRRVDLQPKPPPEHRDEPGFREWHSPTFGNCSVCHQPGPLERHHVISEQHVRREGGQVWDLRNALELGRYCGCHRRHHSAAERLPVSSLPEDALAFALELLGEDRTAQYLLRFYAPR